MSWDVKKYRIRDEVALSLEKSAGISFDEIMALDLEDELNLVKSRTGAFPVFPDSISSSLTPRGNVALALGRQTLPSAIDEGLREMDKAYGV